MNIENCNQRTIFSTVMGKISWKRKNYYTYQFPNIDSGQYWNIKNFFEFIKLLKDNSIGNKKKDL